MDGFLVIWLLSAIVFWFFPFILVIGESEDKENRGVWILLVLLTGLVGLLIFWVASRPKKVEVAASPITSSLLKSICKHKESNVLGRLSLDGPLIRFDPVKETSGGHTYPVKSISNVEVKKGGNRMIVDLQEGTAYTYDWAGGFTVWGELGLNPEEWRSTIIEIKALPQPRTQETYASETRPLTKEELVRSAMKALEQGDKELAKKFMEQAESIGK